MAIEAVITDTDSNLVALDSVYKKCLIDNAERCQRLIDFITVGREDLRNSLTADLVRISEFLRSKEYPAHLTDDILSSYPYLTIGVFYYCLLHFRLYIV